MVGVLLWTVRSVDVDRTQLQFCTAVVGVLLWTVRSVVMDLLCYYYYYYYIFISIFATSNIK